MYPDVCFQMLLCTKNRCLCSRESPLAPEKPCSMAVSLPCSLWGKILWRNGQHDPLHYLNRCLHLHFPLLLRACCQPAEKKLEAGQVLHCISSFWPQVLTPAGLRSHISAGFVALYQRSHFFFFFFPFFLSFLCNHSCVSLEHKSNYTKS